jgi:lipoprotein-anchoring transpeptidase ErfK/SrfK
MATFLTRAGRALALAFTGALCVATLDAAPQQHPKTHPARTARNKPPASKPAFSKDSLALQVALDRAGFSPGEIDGRPGTFTTRAFDAFRQARNLQGTDTQVDDAAIAALGDPYRTPTVNYTVTEADMAGPFQDHIPEDMVEKSKLPALGYTSPLEELAERFHLSPALLTQLNPNVTIAAGATLVVPAVEPLQLPARQGERPAATDGQAQGALVEVTKESNALVVRDAQGGVIMYAPVTVGSEHDPLPIGDWKVTGIFDLPTFNYNPDLFWDADPSHGKARIAAGPNSPVGVIWIQINREHFGMHGTPEPSKIGRTESHGCIRLTNWDVVRLASLVRPGTPVKFR